MFGGFPAVLRYLPTLAIAGAVLFAFWWLLDLVQDNADLQHTIELEKRSRHAAELALQQAEDALAVHRIYLDQSEDREAQYRALISELGQMEGYDAPLSSFLSNAVDRLWP
ncbi:hypothetical protein [uncultured Ruegeria sp.]|uniref:hypothetical protein n=1 Tax=uncultured Ruegeria sp. TaxID=259304 RepID=UPI002611373B|nr:hypothetical protein [uncultured Ruegeria sp.]